MLMTSWCKWFNTITNIYRFHHPLSTSSWIGLFTSYPCNVFLPQLWPKATKKTKCPQQSLTCYRKLGIQGHLISVIFLEGFFHFFSISVTLNLPFWNGHNLMFNPVPPSNECTNSLRNPDPEFKLLSCWSFHMNAHILS